MVPESLHVNKKFKLDILFQKYTFKNRKIIQIDFKLLEHINLVYLHLFNKRLLRPN
jgi:hypothetical protein